MAFSRAQENQWVSQEDTNDVETPFWFVKGEDINYAAQIIFGNMLVDKEDHVLQNESLVLDNNKASLIFSKWLRSESEKDKFDDEAILAIQEECETELLKILSI